MRRLLLTTALVAISAQFAVAGAGAGGQFESKVKINRIDPTGAVGKVKSEKAKCLPGRYVELFLKQPGPDPGRGNDDTNENGRWSLPGASLTEGNYYATVTESEIGAGVCEKDKSDLYVYNPAKRGTLR